MKLISIPIFIFILEKKGNKDDDARMVLFFLLKRRRKVFVSEWLPLLYYHSC